MAVVSPPFCFCKSGTTFLWTSGKFYVDMSTQIYVTDVFVIFNILGFERTKIDLLKVYKCFF